MSIDHGAVEVGRIYADQPEPRWYTRLKRCRAVDCSIAEEHMPEGFCQDCWHWLQAERTGRAMAVAERDEARTLATSMWVMQTPSANNTALWNRVAELAISEWGTLQGDIHG